MNEDFKMVSIGCNLIDVRVGRVRRIGDRCGVGGRVVRRRSVELPGCNCRGVRSVGAGDQWRTVGQKLRRWLGGGDGDDGQQDDSELGNKRLKKNVTRLLFANI